VVAKSLEKKLCNLKEDSVGKALWYPMLELFDGGDKCKPIR
jgi:hypothetical protein